MQNEEFIFSSIKDSIDHTPTHEFVSQLEKKLIHLERMKERKQKIARMSYILTSIASCLFVVFVINTVVENKSLQSAMNKQHLYSGERVPVEEAIKNLSYKIKLPESFPFDIHGGRADVKIVGEEHNPQQMIEINYFNDDEGIVYMLKVSPLPIALNNWLKEGPTLANGSTTQYSINSQGLIEGAQGSILKWSDDNLNYVMSSTRWVYSNSKRDNSTFISEAFMDVQEMIDLANTFSYDSKLPQYVQQKNPIINVDMEQVAKARSTVEILNDSIKRGMTKKEVSQLISSPNEIQSSGSSWIYNMFIADNPVKIPAPSDKTKDMNTITVDGRELTVEDFINVKYRNIGLKLTIFWDKDEKLEQFMALYTLENIRTVYFVGSDMDGNRIDGKWIEQEDRSYKQLLAEQRPRNQYYLYGINKEGLNVIDVDPSTMQRDGQYPEKVIIDSEIYKNSEPSRGDAVLVDIPSEAMGPLSSSKSGKFVTRIIGVPQDFVEIKDGQVFIDDREVNTFYGHEYNWEEGRAHKAYSTNVDETHVDDFQYFIMSDNWAQSPIKGIIPKKYIVGKVVGTLIEE